jgi:uncharacterized membrane protein YphA (DoxX/SURF4 family)
MKRPVLYQPDWATVTLRLGLAFIFLYASISSLVHPAVWVGFLPLFMTKIIAATTLLKGVALYQLVLAVWLLSGQFVRYAALLAAVTLAGIVATNVGDLITTFRDIGLICMAAALFLLEK